MHLPHSIPAMLIDNSFGKLEELRKVLEQTCNKQPHEAFMSIDQLNNMALTAEFIKEKISMIAEKDLLYNIIYYYYHNLLNRISLANLHTLAKKGALPLKLSNIKSALPCASCLFERAYRKL